MSMRLAPEHVARYGTCSRGSVGQKTATETLAGIVVAFWKTRTWSQADLARETGVSRRVVRRVLDELTHAGWPLEREEDHPHVYWSVPNGWFPGGVLFTPDALAALVRVLARVPPTREREKLVALVAGNAPAILANALARIIPPRTSDVEEQFLPAVLDALAQQTPLRLRYFTASRGSYGLRTVSVQRVLVGPPARFIAYCHSAKALRWFRLDHAATLSPDPGDAFHQAEDAEVDAVVQASVDGYHGKERVRVAFFVREPDARWVAQNLPDGLSGVTEDGGLYVEADTAGLLPVARFVVGLGAAAECRSPELARLVAELAEGALGSARGRGSQD